MKGLDKVVTSITHTSERTEHGMTKLAVVDALRGWAIVLVITSHTVGLFPELPWPAKRLAEMGWYGVELFFLISAFTLMRSWAGMQGAFWPKARKFFLRRFWRIAPAYYVAAALYFFIFPPADGFSAEQWFSSLAFISSWTPAWMTTLPDAWQVVRGSWSVSVEFCFYFLFPFVALLLTRPRRYVYLVVFSFLIMCVAPQWGRDLYLDKYGAHAVDLFLFFWFPNQLIVFAMGFLLFMSVREVESDRWRAAREAVRRMAPWMMTTSCIAYAVVAYLPGAKYITAAGIPPTHLLATFVFFALAALLLISERLPKILVNKFICRLGEVSFSAYLVHWAVLEYLKECSWLPLDAIGWAAIAFFPIVLGIAVLITFGVSLPSYLWIELPGVRFGRRLEGRKT